MSRQREGIDISVPFMMVVLLFFMTAMIYLHGEQELEAELQQQKYCEMTQLYKDTNGEHGWPEYNGSCKGK